jgi:hypothetical protein
MMKTFFAKLRFLFCGSVDRELVRDFPEMPTGFKSRGDGKLVFANRSEIEAVAREIWAKEASRITRETVAAVDVKMRKSPGYTR